MVGGSLSMLAWDTGFFKFPVARIQLDRCDDNVLACLLLRARHSQVRLVYAFAPCNANIGASTLSEYQGLLVDQKTTLAKSLSNDNLPAAICVDGVAVAPWPTHSMAPELLALAIDSGGRSRYRIDPEMPAGAFEKLYAVWIKRSVGGQIADVVMAARNDAGVVGMCTVSLRQGVGNIGLIAVCKKQHGRHVGSALLHAAESWLRERNAHTVTMVTQLANRPAVRMCERCGFEVASVQDIFHFWPLKRAAVGRRAAA